VEEGLWVENLEGTVREEIIGSRRRERNRRRIETTVREERRGGWCARERAHREEKEEGRLCFD
jgi:hypothetical protein